MVKQAGFMVLYRAAMPSILIEVGFLSHAEEEKYLASTKGQDELSLKDF
jgi:N-acetylmuramoyl-L-alanine amidase